jgi:biopolymer transport protein ExbB
LLHIFMMGGPLMWPLLLTSIGTVTVVVERLTFLAREAASRNSEAVDHVIESVDTGNIDDAIQYGHASKDFIARTLAYGLENRSRSFSSALLRASNRELLRYQQGLPLLDTVITLAPLLGLLGTVTGMIHAFALLGNHELSAPVAITGGIAQALVATAFGLAIAITALIPFNFLNAKLEVSRQALEDASTQVEILLSRPAKQS